MKKFFFVLINKILQNSSINSFIVGCYASNTVNILLRILERERNIEIQDLIALLVSKILKGFLVRHQLKDFFNWAQKEINNDEICNLEDQMENLRFVKYKFFIKIITELIDEPFDNNTHNIFYYSGDQIFCDYGLIENGACVDATLILEINFDNFL